jgi:ParB/RepB/Spo0J family partition protein
VLQFREIPLDLLDPPKNALRREIPPEEIRLLAESIRELGLLEPIGVAAEAGRFRVRYGHRRLLACQWCRLDPVPCVLGATLEQEDGFATAAENITRRDLTPIEEAQALRGLIDGKGYSIEDAGKSLGRSGSWVRLRLDLLRWPTTFVEAVERGDISVSVGRELVGIENHQVREHYLRCASGSGCTAWQAKIWRQEWEVSAQPDRVGEDLPPVPQMSGTRPTPMAPCHLCETAVEITSLGFMRICHGCATILEREKHDAGNVQTA